MAFKNNWCQYCTYISSLRNLIFLHLRLFLNFLRCKAFRQKGLEAIIVVPIIEVVKLSLGLELGLGSDLQLETVGQMGFGRDMGKEMGHVGEPRGPRAKATEQWTHTR